MNDSVKKSKPSLVHEALRHKRAQLTRVVWYSKLTTVIVTGIIFFALTFLLQYALTKLVDVSDIISFLLVGLWFLFAVRMEYLFLPTRALVERKINKSTPEIAHSSQLISEPSQDLNNLEHLQLIRISTVQLKSLKNIVVGISPRFIVLLMITLLLIVSLMIYERVIDVQSEAQQVSEISKPAASSVNLVEPTAVNVVISPPSYTGAAQYTTDSLNFNAKQGSLVRWDVDFPDSVNTVELVFLSKELSIPLERTANEFNLELNVSSSDLYYFKGKTSNGEEVTSRTYRIKVSIDEVPSINILEPVDQVVEFRSNQHAKVYVNALITDDYGFSDLYWQITAVKGSGEGVKFRDQRLEVNSPFSMTKKIKLSRNFDLKEYGLEPGNEFYMRLVAIDNAKPKRQKVQSPAVIVRWLEEQEVVENVASMQIRYEQEYFRSQRQIIIDTEKLIAQKGIIAEQQFKQQSRDIGFSQQDLKQRYGQYLGDETEDQVNVNLSDSLINGVSDSEQSNSADNNDDHSHDENNHDENSDDEHSKNNSDDHHVGHSHGNATSQSDSAGVNDGRQALIDQYLHDHQYDDAIARSDYDPKYLMRQAVAEMWQAEKYLMLFQPEQALPFEYRAYDFLKRARQADRIYVQRLGFEPPPVSEERRFEGKVNDLNDRFYLNQEYGSTDSFQYSLQHFFAQTNKANFMVRYQSEQSGQYEQVVRLLFDIRQQLLKQKQIELAQAISNQLKKIQRSQNDCYQCILEIRELLKPLQDQPESNLKIKAVPRLYINKGSQ